MTYSDKEAACLWRELRYVYPELAPPKEERDAEQDKDDLFGPRQKGEKDADQGID